MDRDVLRILTGFVAWLSLVMLVFLVAVLSGHFFDGTTTTTITGCARVVHHGNTIECYTDSTTTTTRPVT